MATRTRAPRPVKVRLEVAERADGVRRNGDRSVGGAKAQVSVEERTQPVVGAIETELVSVRLRPYRGQMVLVRGSELGVVGSCQLAWPR